MMLKWIPCYRMLLEVWGDMNLQVHLLGPSFFAKKRSNKCEMPHCFFQLLLSLSQILRSDDDEASISGSSGSYDADSEDSDESSGEEEKAKGFGYHFAKVTIGSCGGFKLPSEGLNIFSSKKRIAHALKFSLCRCLCQVPFKIVLGVCIAFWLLSKQGQDTILWTFSMKMKEKAGRRIGTLEDGFGTKHDEMYKAYKVSKSTASPPDFSQDTMSANKHGCTFLPYQNGDCQVARALSMAKMGDL